MPIQLPDDDEDTEERSVKHTDATEHRMEQVSNYYLKGYTLPKIAEVLCINVVVVKADIARLRQRWKENSRMNYEKRLGQQLAKLDHLEAVAWQAFEKSALDAETKTTRTEYGQPSPKEDKFDKANRKNSRKDRSPHDDGRRKAQINLNESNYKGLVPMRMIEELKKVGQTGDPKWLEIILDCWEKRSKICGMYKSEDRDKPTQVVVIPWSELMGTQPKQGVDRERVNLIELKPELVQNDDDIEDIIERAGEE